MGGRTSERDVERIFATEMETGPHKVVAMVQRGTKGVAFSCALNRCETYPELPEMDDERCRTCIWGEVHASPYALVQGDFTAELVDELGIAIVRREEEEQKVRVAEAKRLVRVCGPPPMGWMLCECYGDGRESVELMEHGNVDWIDVWAGRRPNSRSWRKRGRSRQMSCCRQQCCPRLKIHCTGRQTGRS